MPVELLNKPYLEELALVVPPTGINPGFEGLVRTAPLGPEYIGGAVAPLDQNQPQYVGNVSILDERVRSGGWKEEMRRNPPSMIGITCNYTADVPIVRKLIREIRKEIGKEIPIIVGGHHISLRPTDLFMDEVDAVAIGPGEEIMVEIVKSWAKNHSLEDVQGIWYRDKDNEWQSNTGKRTISRFAEVDSSRMNARPLPRRDLVEQYRDSYHFLYYPGVYSLESSRGCIGACGFCSVWQFHDGGYSVQSVTRTLAELASLPERAKYITLVDDLAFHPVIRENPDTGWKELYNPGRDLAYGLKALGMDKRFRFWAQVRADDVWPRDSEQRAWAKETFRLLASVGVDTLLIGLESLIDVGDLKKEHKGTTLETNIRAVKLLQEELGEEGLGIGVWGAQIVRQEWTISDFARVREANKKLRIKESQYTILTPLPGTKDYYEALRDHQIDIFYPGAYNFFQTVLKTNLPEQVFYEQIAQLYRDTGSLLDSNNRAGLIRDIREGRTTKEAFKEFLRRFKVIQDPQTLSSVARVDPELEKMWRNNILYGTPVRD